MQLGDGTNLNRNTPSADVLAGAAAVAAGCWHTCVLTTLGGVRCWGSNDAGQASVLHVYMLIMLHLLNLIPVISV